MRQGLDIADVESQTKIRAKYLRALENEEWGLLPGPTFVRTFLRTYAEAVGLDPHALVDAYRVAADDVAEPEPAARTAPRAPRAPRRDHGGRDRPPGPPRPLALIGGAVVAVLILLLALGLLGGSDSPSGGDRAVKSTPTRTAKAKTTKRAAPKPASTGVTVRIAPTVPTYACLDSGEGTDRVFEGTLSQARTFRSAKELRVNLGKRSVKLTANGKPVTVAQTAEPYGLQVTRAGATEIIDGPRPCA